VECEVERVDVVVRPESTSDSPSVGVEIKWYGNWWMDDLPGVQLDIEKINEKQYPSAAILFFLKVSPSNSARELAWMSEQIPRQGTNQDLADLVHEHIKRSLDHRGSLALPSHQAFDRASLQYAVWYNDAYRR
jgi:hypothetical protein